MKKYYLVILILLGIHLFLLINLKFTVWPEMLSYPYLRNNGYLLYKDMIHPYPPVLAMALSIVYKLFGYKLIALKVFTWLIILANDILIFLISKKLTKSFKFSVLSLVFYVTIQPFLEGNQLWFDLAIVPTVLFSTYYLLQKKYFWSGLFLGVAILTKQTAGLYLIFGMAYIACKEKNFKKVLEFVIGPIILFAILIVRLITEGAILGFFNWTLIYPLTLFSKFQGYVQMALSGHQWLILVLLVIPVIPVLFIRKFSLITFYLLLSFIMIYPRFSFFHFQLGLAFIAIFYGVFLSRVRFFYMLHATYYILLFVLICLPVLKTDWQKEARFWGKEEIKAAEIITNNTQPDDLVYLLGPQSGLYVFSGRLPPKPWTDNYIWYLEIPGIQEGIIKRWKGNKPEIVFTNNIQAGNWFDLGTYRPQKIVDWIRNEKIEISILK